MGIFTAVILLSWLAKTLLLTSQMLASLTLLQRLFLDSLALLLVVPAIYYAWRLGSGIRRKLLWKIRRRLILVHTFIGFIPILLVVIILNVAGILLYYQLINYLIANQIKIHTTQIQGFNLTLGNRMEEVLAAPGVDLTSVKAIIAKDIKYLLATYPSGEVTVHISGLSMDRRTAWRFSQSGSEVQRDYSVPDWARTGKFSGLSAAFFKPSDLRLEPRTALEKMKQSLFLKSLVFGGAKSQIPFSLELSVPFDRQMLDRLKAALGSDLLLAEGVALSELQVIQMNPEVLQQNILAATFDFESDARRLNGPVWSVLLSPISWETGTTSRAVSSDVLFVEISTVKLLQNVLRSGSSESRTIFGVLQIVIGFFLAVEILSLVIGLLLTRSITHAVYNLDRGTEFIKRGDFTHRIVVRSDDQLGALAQSFNQMTEYIEDLVKERVQKERLERELEIAKEVQEQSFPRQAPRIGRLDLRGLCLPARVVSGDYYDFLPLGKDRLGMALGDICGKGISAALLMANLQATLRSIVLNLTEPPYIAAETETVDGAVARLIGRLNRQIYNYTAANKFASFFYAVYDDVTMSLTYCNAGHNAPLYFNRKGVHHLSVGGTVIGIFPDALYAQETIILAPGDVIITYTDGITESVNEYGEEFGENRLMRLVEENLSRSAAEIEKIIIDRVSSWTFEEERHDDMTLLIGKIL
jgi:sigma-B regulation protein RsbU (phosphoserine phosphatase)